jgi:alpha-glucoside transport system ATP-binding protein
MIQTDGPDYAYSGVVEIKEALGEVTLLYFKKQQPEHDPVIAKLPGIHTGVRGKTLNMTADPAKVHLFRNGQSLLYRA